VQDYACSFRGAGRRLNNPRDLTLQDAYDRGIRAAIAATEIKVRANCASRARVRTVGVSGPDFLALSLLDRGCRHQCRGALDLAEMDLAEVEFFERLDHGVQGRAAGRQVLARAT
jgi:hypothetical protein